MADNFEIQYRIDQNAETMFFKELIFIANLIFQLQRFKRMQKLNKNIQ